MKKLKQKRDSEGETDIVYSKTIKAGKRIYYFDVKKSRKEEMFLSITESKKVVSHESDTPEVRFEKHKLFLYKEDFHKILQALEETIQYIEDEQGPIVGESRMADNDSTPETAATEREETDDFRLDINF